MSKSNVRNRFPQDSVEYTNTIVEEIVESVVVEAARHFEKDRARCRAHDARFFYKKEELDKFWKIFKGDKDSLALNIVKDDMGGFFCYEIRRVKYEL